MIALCMNGGSGVILDLMLCMFVSSDQAALGKLKEGDTLMLKGTAEVVAAPTKVRCVRFCLCWDARPAIISSSGVCCQCPRIRRSCLKRT